MPKCTSREETLDQFMACWEGLEDRRSGNAGLHDFDELLVIAAPAPATANPTTPEKK